MESRNAKVEIRNAKCEMREQPLRFAELGQRCCAPTEIAGLGVRILVAGEGGMIGRRNGRRLGLD
jgi:hypothetical protein